MFIIYSLAAQYLAITKSNNIALIIYATKSSNLRISIGRVEGGIFGDSF